MQQGIDQWIWNHFEHDAAKHQLNGDQDMDEYITQKINELTNYELLFYIDLALQEIKNGS